MNHLIETLRGLQRRPGPAIAAILTLAFAIGMFAAMVSVLQAFLFRPLIVHDVDNVVRVRARISASAGAYMVNPSPALFEAWRSKQTVFEDMAAATGQTVALEGKLESESLPAGLVSANFFHVLGIAPQLGRDFETGEDRSGHDGSLRNGRGARRDRLDDYRRLRHGVSDHTNAPYTSWSERHLSLLRWSGLHRPRWRR